ncbi:Putative GPI-Mannosyltransferase II co-activator, Pga1 [Colletotrichum destructivum]|uniref:GPI-Mannosyltransferase II co-activator, Pga1 n=1 Tax=Colletotrichum destructivum TaxID=34406 RepID=A0AAX4IDP6_9PEZI|nr:Putative GPI-Mannosyltransferase II co-activator, Pga1 [Colletotrichum destructivum]
MRSTFAAAALALACCLDVAHANTEKTIFLGPETVNVPTTPPTIEDLRLDVLTPDDWNKRIELKASFPTGDSPFGATTWLIITNLTQGQRYELRVCWAATQPTTFTLDVFELPTVWGTPELISSLADDAFSRQFEQVDSGNGDKPSQRRKHEYEASLLFVRVQAAADYFTDNATLMTQVEPVSVDLILDPFLLNALPRSLLPTVGYVVVVAILAWFLSRRILVWIQPVLAAESKSAERKKRM